jgi:hypothetical protein
LLRSCRLIHLVGTAGDIFFNPSTGNDRCSGRPGGLGLAAFYFERHPAAAIGGVPLLANWPYTLLVMASTNKALAVTAEQDAGPATRAQIIRWGKLHAVRTCLGIAGAGAFVAASFRG